MGISGAGYGYGGGYGGEFFKGCYGNKFFKGGYGRDYGGSYGRYSGGDGTVMVTDMNVMIGMEDLAMDDRMIAHMEDTVVVCMEGVTIFFPMFFGFNCLCLIVFNYIVCWFHC